MRNELDLNIPLEVLKNINPEEVIILDVRTPHEFVGGHVAGAVNIPYDQLDLFIEDVIGWNKPVIVCSADGRRSSIAANFLKTRGIDTVDAGDWESLQLLFVEGN